MLERRRFRVYYTFPHHIKAGAVLPHIVNQIQYVDRLTYSDDRARDLFEQDYGDKFALLGIRELEGEEYESHNYDEAHDWLANHHGITKCSVNKPVVCPEVWFDGKTDTEKAMKAIRDLCKGNM